MLKKRPIEKIHNSSGAISRGVARLLTFGLKRLRRSSPLHKFLRFVTPSHVVQLDNWQFRVRPADNYTDYHLMVYGQPPELNTYRTIMQECASRSVEFIDIGANTGIYTIPVGRVARACSVIHAFEPNPITRKRLEDNVVLNNLTNVIIHPYALGDRDGRMQLFLSPGRIGNLGQASLIKRTGKKNIPISVAKLSDVIGPRDRQFEVRIIKIDIEGYEDRALSGFIANCAEPDLPDFIIVETAHRSDWQVNLEAIILARGLTKIDETEGNAMFRRC